MVLFLPMLAADLRTGDVFDALRGRQVTICYRGTSTPVPITENPSGETVPGSVLTVGPHAIIPSFDTPEGVYVVDAVAADGTRTTLTSHEGAQVAAEDAAASAATASGEAVTAAARAWSNPAPGIMRPPATQVFPTKSAALAAAAAVGGFQLGDMVFIENPDG